MNPSQAATAPGDAAGDSPSNDLQAQLRSCQRLLQGLIKIREDAVECYHLLKQVLLIDEFSEEILNSQRKYITECEEHIQHMKEAEAWIMGRITDAHHENAQ